MGYYGIMPLTEAATRGKIAKNRQEKAARSTRVLGKTLAPPKTDQAMTSGGRRG
jgi:hypothetical protein